MYIYIIYIYIYICTGIDRYTVYILYIDMGSSATGTPKCKFKIEHDLGDFGVPMVICVM